MWLLCIAARSINITIALENTYPVLHFQSPSLERQSHLWVIKYMFKYVPSSIPNNKALGNNPVCQDQRTDRPIQQIHRMDHIIHKNKCILVPCQLYNTMGEIIFSINNAGIFKWITVQRDGFVYPTSYTKKYLKMNHLKVNAQTLKCLDENIKHKWPWVREWLLIYYTQSTRNQKKKKGIGLSKI